MKVDKNRGILEGVNKHLLVGVVANLGVQSAAQEHTEHKSLSKNAKSTRVIIIT